MPRYFLELAYTGTNYSGFQIQRNANTVQAEVEKALRIYLRQNFDLTGSSRTDTGVHAFQNYFHFDADIDISTKCIYNINSLLPNDIVIKNIFTVPENLHCRFDAISRTYKYIITQTKNPFVLKSAYYFPYKIDFDLINNLAEEVKKFNDFTSFSKRNTQVSSFICKIEISEWNYENNCLVYHVKSNRFLRGMVRALTGTMLRIARNNNYNQVDHFRKIIEAKDCRMADFSVPGHGLFLTNVEFLKTF